MVNASGVGKTKLLLELCYGGGRSFANFQTTFPIKKYFSFATNGGLFRFIDLPPVVSTQQSRDPMQIGLLFLTFLMKYSFSEGKYGNETSKERNDAFSQFMNCTEPVEFLWNSLFTFPGNVFLAVDEADTLLECTFAHTVDDSTIVYNLLQLLRQAVGYFNYRSFQNKFVLVASSTNMHIVDFLPSSIFSPTSKSSPFRIKEYEDYFKRISNKLPVVISSFNTFHLLDIPNKPYSFGRPMWAVEMSKHEPQAKPHIFYTFVLRKIFGSVKQYEKFLLDPDRSLPDAFLFALVFHRVTILDSATDSYSPDMVGRFCLPTDNYDLPTNSFSLIAPTEPALSAGAGFLLWKYPALRKKVQQSMCRLKLPVSPNKGNVGELRSNHGLLLKMDDMKMINVEKQLSYENEMVYFFDHFFDGVPFATFLAHFKLKVPNSIDISQWTLFATTFRRSPQGFALREYRILQPLGLSWLTPPFTPKHDAVIFLVIDKLILQVRTEDKEGELTYADCIRFLKSIPADANLVILLANYHGTSFYMEDHNILRLCLTFLDLGLDNARPYTPPDYSSRMRYGLQADTKSKTECEVKELDESFEAQFNCTPYNWVLIKRNLPCIIGREIQKTWFLSKWLDLYKSQTVLSLKELRRENLKELYEHLFQNNCDASLNKEEIAEQINSTLDISSGTKKMKVSQIVFT